MYMDSHGEVDKVYNFKLKEICAICFKIKYLFKFKLAFLLMLATINYSYEIIIKKIALS